MHKQISSLQNPLIKQILSLRQKSKERRKTGLFVIEGKQEIELAVKGGYDLQTLLFCPEIISEENIERLTFTNIERLEITSEVYKKVAYRTTSEGVLAIANSKELFLDNLTLNAEKLLILVAEAPEKPGNIGALLRTADAANLDAVIIANPKTDLYNPNIIRSSVGCIFTNNIAIGSTDEIIRYLKEKGIAIYCAALQAECTYISCDLI